MELAERATLTTVIPTSIKVACKGFLVSLEIEQVFYVWWRVLACPELLIKYALTITSCIKDIAISVRADLPPSGLIVI